MESPSDQTLCPSCGEPLQTGINRCYHCGHSLVATTVIRAREHHKETRRIQDSAERRRHEFALRAVRQARRRAISIAIGGGVAAILGLYIVGDYLLPGLVLVAAGILMGYIGYSSYRAADIDGIDDA